MGIVIRILQQESEIQRDEVSCVIQNGVNYGFTFA